MVRKGPVQRQQHDIGEQAPRNDGAAYERDVDRDVLQEIVHRAQMTTLSLSHPRTTEGRTEPYLDKLVKDLVKDYKGTGIRRTGVSAFPQRSSSRRAVLRTQGQEICDGGSHNSREAATG